MHRPHFTYKAENREADEDLDDDELHAKYKKDFEEAIKSDIILEPAKDHPEWKWTILWAGFKAFSEYRRRSNYCCPDRFSMYIYNDFEGWGLQELMENQVCLGTIFTRRALLTPTRSLHSTLRSRRKATTR